MEKEQRVYNSALKVEKREDGTSKINGYAALFDSESMDIGFREVIKPGAFKKALRKSDVRALFNHDPNHIIGRSGVNLSLKEDKKGLYMEVSPIPTETYRMVAENIAAGLVSQQSFGFTVAKDEWNDDYTRRTIHEIDELFDVSPVTYPAYPDTTVALRSRDLTMNEAAPKDVEKLEASPDREHIVNIDGMEISIRKITADPSNESLKDDTVDVNERDLSSDESLKDDTVEDPQTEEELDKRFKAIKNKRKGF